MDKLSYLTNANPLACPQRETSGAQTFEKYEYQYHWALCRVLNAHKTLTDYVVFIELHEDVVFANSTDENLAQFEFNQIKSIRGNPYTVKKLVSRPKNGSAQEKNSILGKMILGLNDKPFRKKVHKLNLVATCGFKLPLKTEGLSLSVISVGELHPDCLNEIHSSLSDEIGKDQQIPETLTFVKPNLPDTEFQDTTIGRISRLVSEKTPGAQYNPEDIYRSLIDDLHRKGVVAFDFSKWDALIRNKGLTYVEVDKVISAHTANKGIDLMMPDFEEITREKSLRYHERTRLRRAFERYHNTIHLERTLSTLATQSAIKKAVEDHYTIFEQLGTIEFINTALPTLLKGEIANLMNPESVEAALIYELISKNHET